MTTKLIIEIPDDAKIGIDYDVNDGTTIHINGPASVYYAQEDEPQPDQDNEEDNVTLSCSALAILDIYKEITQPYDDMMSLRDLRTAFCGYWMNLCYTHDERQQRFWAAWNELEHHGAIDNVRITHKDSLVTINPDFL